LKSIKSEADGSDNFKLYDPLQPKAGRKSHTTPRLDSKSGRPGNQSNLSTSQNPVFDEGTTPHTNPTAQININIQLSDVVIDACKTHSGVSPKPDLLPTGQRGQVPQVLLHELSPEIVQMLLQIPGFQNAVANVIRYVTPQGQISAQETPSSLIGDVDPTGEDFSRLSKQLASFVVLTSGIPYDQPDVLLSKLNSGEVPLGFSLDDMSPELQQMLSKLNLSGLGDVKSLGDTSGDQDVMEVDPPAAQTPGSSTSK